MRSPHPCYLPPPVLACLPPSLRPVELPREDDRPTEPMGHAGYVPLATATLPTVREPKRGGPSLAATDALLAGVLGFALGFFAYASLT